MLELRERDFRAFFDTPEQVYGRGSPFVSVFDQDLKRFLDCRKNPLLREFGALTFFTAHRDGRPGDSRRTSTIPRTAAMGGTGAASATSIARRTRRPRGCCSMRPSAGAANAATMRSGATSTSPPWHPRA